MCYTPAFGISSASKTRLILSWAAKELEKFVVVDVGLIASGTIGAEETSVLST
jgi:hypothetical protein